MCFTLFSSSRTPLKERTSRDKKLSQECGLFGRPCGAQDIDQPQAAEGTQRPEARPHRDTGKRQEG